MGRFFTVWVTKKALGSIEGLLQILMCHDVSVAFDIINNFLKLSFHILIPFWIAPTKTEILYHTNCLSSFFLYLA